MRFRAMFLAAGAVATAVFWFASVSQAEPPLPPNPAADAPAAASAPTAVAVPLPQQPANRADLKVIEERVVTVVEKVLPATVAVQVGNSQGSGVIISEDGYVLTAAHVIGEPGLNAMFVLHDGRKVKGRTLGVNHDIDSGLMKITQPGKWPFLEMAPADARAGQWCLSIGHPGGLVAGRPPVPRLGRVLFVNDKAVCTDCALVGGDSGGPLLDLEGHVLGIHSRIGWQVTTNFHVPVATYRTTWDRLAAGKMWGGGVEPLPDLVKPVLGAGGDPDAMPCKISEVKPGSPAEKAGIHVDDVVRKLDGKVIGTFRELRALLDERKPGQRVLLEVLRGDRMIELQLVLGASGP